MGLEKLFSGGGAEALAMAVVEVVAVLPVHPASERTNKHTKQTRVHKTREAIILAEPRRLISPIEGVS